jgi:uncharacterized protein YkwD
MTFVLLLALAAPVDTAALEQRMFELINLERDARGIAPLQRHPDLAAIARDYSRRMAATGRVDHERDRPMEERIGDAVPDTCMFGENVSKNTSVDYALSDLMTSEGHRANLLNPRYVNVGIGIVRGEGDYLYITQEFSRPCGPRFPR